MAVEEEAEENRTQNLAAVEEAEEVKENRTPNLAAVAEAEEVAVHPLTWQEEGVEEGNWHLWSSLMKVAAGEEVEKS